MLVKNRENYFWSVCFALWLIEQGILHATFGDAVVLDKLWIAQKETDQSVSIP